MESLRAKASSRRYTREELHSREGNNWAEQTQQSLRLHTSQFGAQHGMSQRYSEIDSKSDCCTQDVRETSHSDAWCSTLSLPSTTKPPVSSGREGLILFYLEHESHLGCRGRGCFQGANFSVLGSVCVFPVIVIDRLITATGGLICSFKLVGKSHARKRPSRSDRVVVSSNAPQRCAYVWTLTQCLNSPRNCLIHHTVQNESS